jgi:hypothetical protein
MQQPALRIKVLSVKRPAGASLKLPSLATHIRQTAWATKEQPTGWAVPADQLQGKGGVCGAS